MIGTHSMLLRATFKAVGDLLGLGEAVVVVRLRKMILIKQINLTLNLNS